MSQGGPANKMLAEHTDDSLEAVCCVGRPLEERPLTLAQLVQRSQKSRGVRCFASATKLPMNFRK